MITGVVGKEVMTTTQLAEARSVAEAYLGYMHKDERQPMDLSADDALKLCRAYMSLTAPSGIGNDDPHEEGDSLVGSLPRGLEYLSKVAQVCDIDAETIITADKAYGGSWQQRGGLGAFMMLARKWDRLETRVKAHGYDIFVAIQKDTRREGVIDDVRDLRRYFTLVEAVAIYRQWVVPQTVTKESAV
jgi:hypothetical protein